MLGPGTTVVIITLISVNNQRLQSRLELSVSQPFDVSCTRSVSLADGELQITCTVNSAESQTIEGATPIINGVESADTGSLTGD